MKIQIQGVGKRFRVRDADRPFTALDDVNLDVRTGEFLTLVGPSGCGTSTLLGLLAGLAEPTSGRILLDGAPVDGPGPSLGIVFQQDTPSPRRTALPGAGSGPGAEAVPRRKRKERARSYLELVGLRELSGGTRRRAALARSLAAGPDVLLMDDPFAALDRRTREPLQEELLRIWQETGKTIVFVTRDIDEAVYLGRRIAVVTPRPGRIKGIVDVAFDSREGDLRAGARFAEYRREVWSLLRAEDGDRTSRQNDESRSEQKAP
ncbi:NitT/TauT family transport system ATP-binding protein [Streptosporangium album]|uniref:NitT/TauT family transport system ATP-binding protein n=1 Tax=Streptosporangium album TaxID=47479 RepID=A0A7W7W7G4_9ACTN|nr:ATP-binding cassette domain-containing protein [Streptosporangium album]MBB4937287.1 NitT/TauT family transport system ATP-binding protein [Streptosporangium album]